METNKHGYGFTPFPSVTGIKAITKPDVATQIMNAFGALETTLKNIQPLSGNEVQLAESWGSLSAIRAEFVDLCSGTQKVGHA